MKFASVFGHVPSARLYEAWEGWPLPKCNIGLEWEFEQGTSLRDRVARANSNSYLSLHEDGSLRDNGVEVVTAGDGLYGKDLLASIELLKKTLDALGPDYKPVCNYRTGFHVHIDARDMEENELHNMLMLYCMLEVPIFNFVGKDRWKSNFCVPWFRSDSQFPLLRQLEGASALGKKSLDAVGLRIKGLQRYSALNCQALAKLGTLEFRHMENSLDDVPAKQMDFVRIIMHLKRLAIQYSARGLTGKALFRHLKEENGAGLLRELQFPLPLGPLNWDYTESLMLLAGMVEFGPTEANAFSDLLFDAFLGKHRNWR